MILEPQGSRAGPSFSLQGPRAAGRVSPLFRAPGPQGRVSPLFRAPGPQGGSLLSPGSQGRREGLSSLQGPRAAGRAPPSLFQAWAADVSGCVCLCGPVAPCAWGCLLTSLSPSHQDTGTCPQAPRDSAAHPSLLTFFSMLFPGEGDITLCPHGVLLTGPRAWGHFSPTSGYFFHGV